MDSTKHVLLLNRPNNQALWSSLRYFSITRMVVASILVGTSMVSGSHAYGPDLLAELFQRTVITYLIVSATMAYLAASKQRYFYAQLAAQLLLDGFALTMVLFSTGGIRSGLALLFLLPVAGAAILTPALWALGFAAACALAILGESAWRALTDAESVNFFQAGLYAFACFAMALVMNRLAGRLIRQERIAEERGVSLQSQLEINRLVVADMQDGVLILSEEGEPRALNPAAQRMLFVSDEQTLVSQGWGKHAAGLALRQHFWAWIAEPNMVADHFDLVVTNELAKRGEIYEHRLRARFFMHARRITGGDFVVMLEDLRRLEERAQQLKLASMGRLTASIAHEIRNPLSAIGHASALMAEEVEQDIETHRQQAAAEHMEHDPHVVRQTKILDGRQRLLRIVHDNTRRLDRIVQDILQLSRRASSEPDTIALGEYLEQLVMEFCRDQGIAPDMIRLSVESASMIRFNGDQLRQVLVNLLQNACRYASGKPGSVVLLAMSTPVSGHLRMLGPTSPQLASHQSQFKLERIELRVQDDGPGISAEVRRQLFEPFFTTESNGTGLGLYLARELCAANGASLIYVPMPTGPNPGGFVINATAALHRL